MREYSFVVPGIPIAQGSMRAYRRRNGSVGMEAGNVKKMQDYRARIALAAQGAGIPLLDEAVIIDADFYFPRPKGHFGSGRNAGVLKAHAPLVPSGRPDIDKCLRALFDGLTNVVLRDDCLIVQIGCSKLYAESGSAPRTEVTVLPLSEVSTEAAKEAASG